jgi:hypothetical protein
MNVEGALQYFDRLLLEITMLSILEVCTIALMI